jgi:high-affinity iron transporter
MLFWMRRQAASVKGQLQAAVDRALGTGSARALGFLAFVAVIREGLETSLFLTGQAASADGAASSIVVGAIIGLGIAVLLGIGFYQGSRRLNFGAFFRWTGIALVFIAAGLLAHAAHEFIEIGIIRFGTQTLFDLSGILPHQPEGGSLVGQFLQAIFGYTATPELTTFVVWFAYVAVVLTMYLRPLPPMSARPDSSIAAARG